MPLTRKKLLVKGSISFLFLQLSSCRFFHSSGSSSSSIGDTLSGSASIAAPTPASAPPSPPSPDPVKLRELLDRGDIPAAVQEIEKGWQKNYQDYYQRNQNAPAMSVAAIATVLGENNQLTGRKAALIYAVPTPQALELIVVTADGTPVHVRNDTATRDSLATLIQSFRTAIVDLKTTPAIYLPPAQQLYEWMIQPLEAELRSRQIDTLIFCVGARLRSTPLAALHDGEKFLAQHYQIAIIPAFSLLDQRPTPLQDTRVLAMGASQFQNLAPLPAVPVELAVIADHLWQGEERLNQQFTVSNLNEARSQYPYGIVHLATHAEFTPGSANESYIQFWNQQLPLSQLEQLNLRSPVVQLLVLSACQTALGDTNAELGFAGLAVQSGCQAAIASLWSVSDIGTLVLMSELYRELKTTPIKAEALQKAQLALLNQQVDLNSNLITRASQSAQAPTIHSEVAQLDRSDLAHPYYWAAFTLIGNPW